MNKGAATWSITKGLRCGHQSCCVCESYILNNMLLKRVRLRGHSQALRTAGSGSPRRAHQKNGSLSPADAEIFQFSGSTSGGCGLRAFVGYDKHTISEPRSAAPGLIFMGSPARWSNCRHDLTANMRAEDSRQHLQQSQATDSMPHHLSSRRVQSTRLRHLRQPAE